jgi:ABC-2 type transport system permease protein
MLRALTRKMMKVAGMEFRLTAANKAFVIVTIIGPFLIIGISVLPTVLAVNEPAPTEASRVVIVGGAEIRGPLESAFPPSAVAIVDGPEDTTSLNQMLLNDQIDGYVMLPDDPTHAETVRFVTSGAVNFQLNGVIEGVVGQVIVGMRLAEAGFDATEVRMLSQPPRLDVRSIDAEGGEQSQDMTSIILTTLAFTMMLYMTILLYGQSIGRSVLNEKLSKTVEVMLSSLSPRELLVGKLVGKAAASLLQYGIWILMAVVFLQFIGPMVGVQVNLAAGPEYYLYLVGFFLLAFMLYSTFYCAIGAASEDEMHMAQLSWPVIFFLVIPMMMMGVAMNNPDGTIMRAFSLFPLTAPIVMFQRVLIGEPAAWEIATSVGLLLVTIAAVSVFAAKIFRVGILMTGKRFSLPEIIKWLRYKE